MKDFILLMHDDTIVPLKPDMWPSYFATLRGLGVFDGGSAIGAGRAFRQGNEPRPITDDLGGYLRVRAESLAAAAELLTGNPIFECGGTVEIRELPRDGD